jgi:hypothetical protein
MSPPNMAHINAVRPSYRSIVANMIKGKAVGQYNVIRNNHTLSIAFAMSTFFRRSNSTMSLWHLRSAKRRALLPSWIDEEQQRKASKIRSISVYYVNEKTEIWLNDNMTRILVLSNIKRVLYKW